MVAMRLLEMETIENRERWFRGVVLDHNITMQMSEKNIEDFLDYWSQEKTYKHEQLMLFEITEKKSAFDIRKRMAYWKRNNPEKERATGEKFLDYWSAYYDKKLGDIQRQQEYRKHLRALGYKFTYHPGAGEVVNPPK